MGSGFLRKLAIAALLAGVSCSSVGQAAFAKTEAVKAEMPGWFMNTTSNFGGIMDCWVVPIGLKFKLSKLGLTIVSKAPVWDAYIYNDTNKSMMKVPQSEWRTKFLMHRGKQTDKAEEWQVESTKQIQTINGIKTHKVLLKKKRGTQNKMMPMVEIWLAPGVRVPMQFFKLMEALGLKVGEAETEAPIKMTSFTYRGDTIIERVVGFECLKAVKQTIPTNIFTAPTGYKVVQDEMALMMDEGDEEMMGAKDTPSIATPPKKPKTSDDMSSFFGEIKSRMKGK